MDQEKKSIFSMGIGRFFNERRLENERKKYIEMLNTKSKERNYPDYKSEFDEAILTIPEELRKDKKFICSVLKNISNDKNSNRDLKENFFSLVDPKLKDNKDIVLEYISTEGDFPEKELQYLGKLRDDREVMSKLIEQNRGNLKYASARLKGDKSIVREAVRSTPYVIEYASEKLRKDKDFVIDLVLEAIEKKANDLHDVTWAYKYGPMIENVKDCLKDNKEIMKKLIHYEEDFSKYLSEKLRDDKEFILEIIKDRNSTILKYASPRLQDDREVIMEAIEHVSSQIQYASKRLKNDKELISKAFENSWNDFSYISKDQENTEILIAAIKRFGTVAPEIVSSEFGEFIDPTFTQYETFMSNLTENARDNKEIMLAAIDENGSAFKYGSERMRSDKELLNLALERYSYDFPLEYASESLKNDKEIILKAINKNSENIAFASLEIRNDPEVVMKAIKSNGSNFKYISDELKNNKDFILSALLENTNIYSYIPESQKENTASSKDLILKVLKENYGVDINLSEIKTQEKVTTVEKKVENFKSKETSKEKATRSRARSKGNER
jgi:hypothetical protein